MSSSMASLTQFWFFCKEDMVLPQFVQKQHTFADILKNGITLHHCLKVTNTSGKAEKYAFYTYSASMAAAVRLLNDESILTTHTLYCLKDPVVTLPIRDIHEPSPNTSRAASHHNSLAERHKISGACGFLVPEIFIQPQARHESNSVDVSTMERIDGEMMTQGYLEGPLMVFPGWISSELDGGKSLTDTVVQSFGAGGAMTKLQWSAAIWERSLVWGPQKDAFLALWNQYNRVLVAPQQALETICKNVPGFSQACQNFIHDLWTYSRDKGSQKRLDGTGHEFFIGPPYFNAQTRDILLGIPTKNGTLESDLRQLAVKRQDSEICAAHDLSPLYEAILGVKWEGNRGKAVTLNQAMSGLSLDGPGSQQETSPVKSQKLAKQTSRFFKNVKNATFGPKQGIGGGRGGDMGGGW